MKKTCSAYLIFYKEGSNKEILRQGVLFKGKNLNLNILDTQYRGRPAFFFKYGGGLHPKRVRAHYPKPDYKVYPLHGRMSKSQPFALYITS